MIRSLAALTLLLASTSALAQGNRSGQQRDANAWDVNNPPGQTQRAVRIQTNEGTWMNLDVSPDGRTVAFDLLGDIYTMPIARASPTISSRASRPTGAASPSPRTAAAATISG
jgi:hypothetical protein